MIEHRYLLGNLDNLIHSCIVVFIFFICFKCRPLLIHINGSTRKQYNSKGYEHNYVSLYYKNKTQEPNLFFFWFLTAALVLLLVVNESVTIDVPAHFRQEHKKEKDQVHFEFLPSWIFCFPPKSNQREPFEQVTNVDHKVAN